MRTWQEKHRAIQTLDWATNFPINGYGNFTNECGGEIGWGGEVLGLGFCYPLACGVGRVSWPVCVSARRLLVAGEFIGGAPGAESRGLVQILLPIAGTG